MAKLSGDNVLVANDTSQSAIDDQRYDVENYLVKVPTDAVLIDSLGVDRNFARYQLGLIYKEKFKEYEIAAV